MRATLLFLLLAGPASAKKDDYAPLKGLLGTWTVDRDCRGLKDKLLVKIVRLPSAVRATYFDARDLKKIWGKTEVFYNADADRFKAYTYFTNNAVSAVLGTSAIPGAVEVTTDDAEDGEPNNIVTGTAKVSALNGSLTLRLVDGYTKASLRMNGKTPLGIMGCTGVGLKQPVKK